MCNQHDFYVRRNKIMKNQRPYILTFNISSGILLDGILFHHAPSFRWGHDGMNKIACPLRMHLIAYLLLYILVL